MIYKLFLHFFTKFSYKSFVMLQNCCNFAKEIKAKTKTINVDKVSAHLLTKKFKVL